MFIEIGVPNVEDEDSAHLVATVPRLMFDRVVEDQRLARLPLSPLVTDAKPATRRYDQGHMNDQPRVGDAGVRRDQGFRSERREESAGGRARDLRHRYLFEKG